MTVRSEIRSGLDRKGDVYSYTVWVHEWLRPCGHKHRCIKPFATDVEAAYDEKWAKANTLCGECSDSAGSGLS